MGLKVFWLQLAEDKLDDIYKYYSIKAGKRIAKKIVTGKTRNNAFKKQSIKSCGLVCPDFVGKVRVKAHRSSYTKTFHKKPRSFPQSFFSNCSNLPIFFYKLKFNFEGFPILR